MTTYLSPGVYVKEVSSGAAPIAGVGTSTAGFIGVISNQPFIKATDAEKENSPQQTPLKENGNEALGGTTKQTFQFDIEPPLASAENALKQYQFFTRVDGEEPESISTSEITLDTATKKIKVKFSEPPPNNAALLVSYTPPALSNESAADQNAPLQGDRYVIAKVEDVEVGEGDGSIKNFPLANFPADAQNWTVKVGGTDKTASGDYTLNTDTPTPQIEFNTAPAEDSTIKISYEWSSVAADEVKLCTNFTEFKKYFGDFSKVDGQSHLAHAVYGFFRNGGTRCYVSWVKAEGDISDLLDETFAAIDEIAIVAAPGLKTKDHVESIIDHCETLGDRVAIIDSAENDAATGLVPRATDTPRKSQYAAFYYPWIEVFDPATKGNKFVPPSGHIAGIYARVDSQRGVHKAPANEIVQGASGLKKALTRAKQDGLNPQGVNCIRNLNGAITVWGARTWGGDDNGEFKYINTRRLFNYIRESIDEGTQWAVFEPNSPELWAKVRRSVTAFLTLVWRSGALFGSTPDEAFSVQCDAETNPPEVRAAGQLVTKVGVAIVKPAEFVIFELSQKSSGGQ